MSAYDISGHRLEARVVLDGVGPPASVLRFLADLAEPIGGGGASLEVRARRSTTAAPPIAGAHDVRWRSDEVGIVEVDWRHAGRISGVDGSGVVDVAVEPDAPSGGWMLRTAIGSAACVSGRVLGVHGCVLRAPDGATILLLGPGGSGKTSLSLWLVAWRGYRLIVEDFVYLRSDWSVVTAPVRDFLTLRRWTWELLRAAPSAEARPVGAFRADAEQVRAPLAPWLHRTAGPVMVDVVVRVERSGTPAVEASRNGALPLVAADRALAACSELRLTEWLARFARHAPGPRAIPVEPRPAVLLSLDSDWHHRTTWLTALEGVTSRHAA